MPKAAKPKAAPKKTEQPAPEPALGKNEYIEQLERDKSELEETVAQLHAKVEAGPSRQTNAVRCKTAFFHTPSEVIHAGTVLSADDPRVKGRESHFESVENAVERATAAPGEGRNVRRPRRS